MKSKNSSEVFFQYSAMSAPAEAGDIELLELLYESTGRILMNLRRFSKACDR